MNRRIGLLNDLGMRYSLLPWTWIMDRRRDRGTFLSLPHKPMGAAVTMVPSTFAKITNRAMHTTSLLTIPLPVAWHRAAFDLMRPPMNADQRWKLLASILDTRSQPALANGFCRLAMSSLFLLPRGISYREL